MLPEMPRSMLRNAVLLGLFAVAHQHIHQSRVVVEFLGISRAYGNR